MRKLAVLFIAVVMIFSLVACGTNNTSASSTEGTSDTTSQTSASSQTSGTTTESGEPQPSDSELRLMWHQAIGIDTIFETPWKDMQSLATFMVYEALVAAEPDNSVSGAIASEWSVSDDGLTYTFTIRQGVTWHDGEPLTPEGVAWSISAHAMTPGSGYATCMNFIEGKAETAEAAAAEEGAVASILPGITFDDKTVTIKITSPNRAFLLNIAQHKVLPMHLLKDVPLTELMSYEDFWSHPIGTGPYKIDEISFPDYFTAVPFENYWGEQPGIKKLLFTSYAAGGNDSAINALIAGELDFAHGNNFNDIGVAENIKAQNSNMTYVMQTSNYNRKLVFNLDFREDGKMKDDMNNPKIRQAFNLLLDKEAMAGVYSGQADALTTFVPSSDPRYNSDIPLFERNVEEAKRLLEEANFDFSQTIDIVYYYSDQASIDLMAFLKQNFEEAGVSVNVNLLTGDLGTQLNVLKNYDISYASNGSRVDTIEQYETICSFFSSAKGDTEYRKEHYDTPYNAYLATQNDEEAQQYIDQLQVNLLEGCHAIPIYAMNTIMIYDNSKLTVPESIFTYDNITVRNWHWEDWSMK